VQYAPAHSSSPDASFDGGSLDCGSGLLLLIRRHIDPLPGGRLLEIRSTEPSVEEDLPSWCRMTGNDLLSIVRRGPERSYLVRKKGAQGTMPEGVDSKVATNAVGPHPAQPVGRELTHDAIAPLSVMGIGSWSRSPSVLAALPQYLSGRISDAHFHAIADLAVADLIVAQERAGVDVVTDGEQRRDSYASFIGNRLENCQLVPIVDLLSYVDEPDKFREELTALDVPAESVRHPAVFGKLARRTPIVVPELQFAQSRTSRPIKVALPGPYLLTRTMWLDCISDKAYDTREELADDIVRALREELQDLLAAGAAIVQFDEPVLTEVVFGAPRQSRSFMCGALSERREPTEELRFATGLINRVLDGFPRERTAVHICRGNWSRDESVALAGDYRPLVPTLCEFNVGHLFLELCTSRAGELDSLRQLPQDIRIGVGVVNQKLDRVETASEITARGEAAIAAFGAQRVLLNPDCGFATFADRPIASASVAERKLAGIVQASRQLRAQHGLSPRSTD
jgi:5-methyltetrahydropteroyltriglutamate--homocysteine methyltransferase